MEKLVLNFTDCNLPDLDKLFGLRWVRSLPELNAWIDSAKPIEVSEYEKTACTNLKKLLDLNAFHWREQDLSLHFIGPMFSLINFTEPYRYNLFAQRPLQSTFSDTKGRTVDLMGRPDEILASGYGNPETPYFAFNEFKKEVESKGDPAGQVLGAMLVGQALNENHAPVYGCYVLGRDWYFLVLKDNLYSISRGFDGTTDDIFDIFKILTALKNIVIELTS